jgi:outer membrane protein TolC
VALLSACAAVPDLGPQPVVRAPASIAADRSLQADGSAQWPSEGWWKGYGDPQLDALIEEGLKGSPDVSAAAARFAQANAAAQQAGAPLLPSVDLDASSGVTKSSYNMGMPKEFVPKGWLGTGRVALDFGFDLDLWGRNRAALAAATSEARAAEIDARQARLALAAGVADAYADLARLYDERDIMTSVTFRPARWKSAPPAGSWWRTAAPTGWKRAAASGRPTPPYSPPRRSSPPPTRRLPSASIRSPH